MKEQALDSLLTKLNHGNDDAAEQVFLAYEPYLRMVVRRQLSRSLRTKFDSLDVVQSVWADLLRGFRETRWEFQDAEHLRAFLVRATRNRFIDRLRENTTAVQCEVPDADGMNCDTLPGHDPRPSQVAQASELWDRLVADCPPAHVEILQLKRQGASLDDIATKTGYHKSSVRRILYELSRRYAAQDRVDDAP